MATRNHILDRVEGHSPESLRVIRWTGLLTTDVGDWITIPEHTDYTVQMVIDSGTTLAALSLEGSNAVGVPAAKNIGILNDSRGYANPITYAFADGGKLKQGLESTVQMRPNFSGAGDSSVTVIVSFKKAIF
jgi:hypothetical protein